MSEVKRYETVWNEIRDTLELAEEKGGSLVSYGDYAALQKERDALAVLAEERRQFIVNGVEMGDILLPVIDGNPAIGIHERCLLKPKFAYDAYINSVRAEGVKMFAKHCDDNVSFVEPEDEELYTLMEEAATAFADQLRAGEPS